MAVCHSWLLSPALSRLLRSDSNILRFQRMFELVGLDDSSRQAEERIFGDIRPQPSDYPVSTTLQRAARQWLLDGNPLPSAYGYRHLQPSP